jgi:hypothetical protein
MDAGHAALRRRLRIMLDAFLGAVLGVCAVGVLFVLASFLAGLTAGA